MFVLIENMKINGMDALFCNLLQSISRQMIHHFSRDWRLIAFSQQIILLSRLSAYYELPYFQIWHPMRLHQIQMAQLVPDDSLLNCWQLLKYSMFCNTWCFSSGIGAATKWYVYFWWSLIIQQWLLKTIVKKIRLGYV